MESEIKRDKTEMNISFWSWRKGEKIRTREKRKEKKKKKKKITGMEFEYGCMDMCLGLYGIRVWIHGLEPLSCVRFGFGNS